MYESRNAGDNRTRWFANRPLYVPNAAASLGAAETRLPLGWWVKLCSGGYAMNVEMLPSLIPLLVVSALLAWGNYNLAERTGRSGILYVVITFIPVFSFCVTVYLFYRAILFAIDRSSAAPSH
jgi:hypothetical protein